MAKLYQFSCPRCNNNHSFYRYGRDKDGYQKYLCRKCYHQFAPERPRAKRANCRRKYPPCPVCGKASFLHHDYEHYSNYRCCDKKCNHSFFVYKPTAITSPSMSSFLENMILNVCVIPYILSLQLCPCFIWVKTLSATLA